MSAPAIRASGLSKRFAKAAEPASLKGALLARLRGGGAPGPEHLALDAVSFAIAKGEAVALVGGNGSGKSTLLRLLAGILAPSAGTAEVRGRLAPLIETGAGFSPDLTGRENALLHGAILGVPRRLMKARLDAIVAFAGLEALIDQPVRTYSSGQAARLGLAVAVHAEPDVLLADEALAVGDRAFRARAIARVAALRDAGTTVVVVSHEADQLRALCARGLLLEGGRLTADGPLEAVLRAYEAPGP